MIVNYLYRTYGVPLHNVFENWTRGTSHFMLKFDYAIFYTNLTSCLSIPKMRIWSILLIKSDLKWCIHLSRRLYLYYLHKMHARACNIVEYVNHNSQTFQ